MSGTSDRAPDPLALLRASDRRPPAEVWREKLFSNALPALRERASQFVFATLLTALIVGVAWRLFVATEPPVEASLPFAQATTVGTTRVEVTSIAPVPTTELMGEIVVHVAGAVYEPGIVVGDATWRVDDAVREAGGAVSTADLDRVNLAAPLVDGSRVFVPHIDQAVPPVLNINAADAAGGGQVLDSSHVVDLNTAEASELETLPGVGPATAAAIISHREEFGAFGNVDALVAVSGIGPATLETLRDLVSV